MPSLTGDPTPLDGVSVTPAGHAPTEPLETALARSAPQPGRRFVRNVMIYGLGNILARIVSFVMLPVYTRYLTPADYGILQLLDITVEVVALFISAGATSGVLRFYFKSNDPADRRRVIATAFFIQAGLDAIGMAILLGAAPWVHTVFLKGAGATWMVRVAAVNFFLSACVTVPLIFAQSEHRAGLLSGSQLGKLTLQLSLNILFVVGLHRGAGGILLSTLIANLIVSPALVGWMVRRSGLRGSMSVAKQLRRFGLPYQAVTMGTFVLAFGDRFFLQRSRDVSAVGLYGLAYQFGFLVIQLATVPYLKAWEPLRHQYAHLPPDERDAHYRIGFKYFFLVHVTLVSALCIAAQPLIHVMTTAAFFPAARLIPIIAIAYLFQGCTDYFDHGMQAAERTIYSTYATWTSVVLVVILYATLIPPFGGLGAAVATLAAFVVRAGLTYYFAQKVWPVRWEWGTPLRMAALGIATVAAVEVIAPRRTWMQIGVGAGAFAFYLALAWTFVLAADDRRLVMRYVARALRPASMMANADA